MANGDLYRCTYQYNVARQPVTITLGFEETATTGDVADEVCSMISLHVSGIIATQAGLFAADVTLEGAKTRKITGMPQAPGEAFALTTAGEFAGQSVPATKSLMVMHKQVAGDVRRNGKSYITGMAESLTVGNEMANAVLPDALVAMFEDLQDVNQAIPAGTLTARMVVLSHPPAQPNTWIGLPVTGHTCRNILYNSRRRQTRELGYALN